MTESQFATLYDEYADALYRYCYYKTSDMEVAKDLVSDTFIRAWEYFVRGEKVENHKAFFYKVASNLIIDYRRKKKTISLDLLTEDGFDVATDEHARIEDIIDSKQALEYLKKIPAEYREAVYLRYIEDLGPKEIAVALGISENLASVRINRGLEKLRAVFKK